MKQFKLGEKLNFESRALKQFALYADFCGNDNHRTIT